ncbi:MAG: hypothetical protein JW763_01125 [candidate division Zixibacteria bacterium]|nr:hypothetical protein [candidate division Zixibacteria bacterium]
MRWSRKKAKGADSEAVLAQLQGKFSHFVGLLECNSRSLKTIGDMEEKAQGDYLFDINYIRTSYNDVVSDIDRIITHLSALGDGKYGDLRDRFNTIRKNIGALLPGNKEITRDDYTVAYDSLGRENADSVGSKNAQLGEMKSRLGLPVPEGFAITAWAYRHFVSANDLQSRINEKLSELDIRQYSDLVTVSEQIQAMVVASPVPQDLEAAILRSYNDLIARAPSERFSLRSSALGEDTLFSFAGQYATFLNVPEEELVARYRDVLASKFTPKAIYYLLSHDLSESELAMSVGCVSMIDAAVSGVIYTRDPVEPDNGCLVVNSIYGLGKYLVDGRLTPDTFHVSRDDFLLDHATLAVKPVCLVIDLEGGTVEEPVADFLQKEASLTEAQLRRLAEYAMKLEEHYDCPQDIEWAIDRAGKIYILQSRPLRVLRCGIVASEPDIDTLRVLIDHGTPVCPGIGGGPVYQVRSTQDLARVPNNAVLVAPGPFPGLITVMGKISALVTCVGGMASHLATIAREFRMPTLMGVEQAADLPNGKEITVDACRGTIFDGLQRELIEVRRVDEEIFDDTGIFAILESMLTYIAPLNLLDPTSPEFVTDNCHTLHDITRFAHQKAMDEMFAVAAGVKRQQDVGVLLKSTIPLQVKIIYIDREYDEYASQKYVPEDDMKSLPMAAFWKGIHTEGWPSHTPTASVKGFMGVIGTTVAKGGVNGFSENSFAVLGETYMMLSLRMGYHFTTVEAMCTEDTSRNFIRMQYKEGGATIDRRIRRIKLISDILQEMGFENHSRADFLDTLITYCDCDTIEQKLTLLGRLTILTKQLDMALSTDQVAAWYTRDIMVKLGLKTRDEETA